MSGLLYLLGLLFVSSTCMLLSLRSERRGIIFDRLRLGRRRDSGSRTPPRSLSPEKKRSQSTSIPEYATTFPPSRQYALGEVKDASQMVNKHLLPITETYRDAPDNTLTPCGFSIAEIKALGDFPDFATLSGVPLPKPYNNFDVQKAVPRPYRPFRWAYHQTMCKSQYPPSCYGCSQATQLLQRWSPTGG